MRSFVFPSSSPMHMCSKYFTSLMILVKCHRTKTEYISLYRSIVELTNIILIKVYQLYKIRVFSMECQHLDSRACASIVELRIMWRLHYIGTTVCPAPELGTATERLIKCKNKCDKQKHTHTKWYFDKYQLSLTIRAILRIICNLAGLVPFRRVN